MTKRNVWIIFFTALVLGLVTAFGDADLEPVGLHQGYAPEQPVAFSHQLHAGNLAIDCKYCHTGVEVSRHAGIPPAGLCMNCHRFVTATWDQVKLEDAAAERQGREPRPVVSPEIAKIYASLGLSPDQEPLAGGEEQPLRWVKVHNLPDFVYFHHGRHVNAGVPCADCHGPVEQMVRVRQVEDLSMGWCLDCHRRVNREGLNGTRDIHASLDCAACHF